MLRVAMTNNPYQGLKHHDHKKSGLPTVAMTNNPYQGLKLHYSEVVVAMTNNPYQGLKLNLNRNLFADVPYNS